MPFTYEQKEIQGEAAAQVTGYEGEVSRLRIPEQIDGLRVLGIGSNAFSWREDIHNKARKKRPSIIRYYSPSA